MTTEADTSPTATDEPEANQAPAAPPDLDLPAAEPDEPKTDLTRVNDTGAELNAKFLGGGFQLKTGNLKLVAALTFATLMVVVGAAVWAMEWLAHRHHVHGGDVLVLDTIAVVVTGCAGWIAIERWSAPQTSVNPGPH